MYPFDGHEPCVFGHNIVALSRKGQKTPTAKVEYWAKSGWRGGGQRGHACLERLTGPAICRARSKTKSSPRTRLQA